MELYREVEPLSEFSDEKMKKNNLFTTENLFCDVYCFEPGQTQKTHSHGGSDKIYYVLDGRAQLQIGEEEREVGPGTAVLAPAGVAHGARNPGPDRLKLLVVMAPAP